MATTETMKTNAVSPLVLADRLLALAQDAERAGLSRSAGRLVGLAHSVFDESAGAGGVADGRRAAGRGAGAV